MARSGTGITYMQVLALDWFHVEYQEGSLDENYVCTDELSQEDVIVALQAYRNRDESWKTYFQWEKQELL